MKCKEFEVIASTCFDGEADEHETASYRAHLDECVICRGVQHQIKSTSQVLKNLKPVEVPMELHGYIMSEARLESSGEAALGQRLLKILLSFNPRLVSYGAGALASLMMFSITLAGFRPFPIVSRVLEPLAEVVQIVRGSDNEYHAYNNLPVDPEGSTDNHFYELPRVNPQSSLVSFSHIAYQKPGEEGAAALVEIQPDGTARIVQVLEHPHDPALLRTLSWSLSKRPFQPAIIEGKPVLTRIVMVVEKVDVWG
ncbi:MAG: hypothetical protein DMF61_11550 [Blastocatellia bacterium AA13]|nr:MAG: hypothetical protein DMF61_11550 [Blastocatellia bacterium AA13]